MARAVQPSRRAPAERQIGALVRAGPLRRDDPATVPHEDELMRPRPDRCQRPVAEKAVGTEADPDRPGPLRRRDRLPGHADRR